MRTRPSIVIALMLGAGVGGCFILAGRKHPGWPVPRPVSSSPGGGAGRKLLFNQDIEPILAANCYACHGPDPGGRKAGLRLDRAEFAFAPHEKSGPSIVRNDPDHSPLVLRVESNDPKKRMPPLEAHKILDPGQIAVLRRWVKEGAEYQDHWAFIPPQRPALPATERTDWARNAIDRLVLARLEREGLPPSPEADRPTLIRRVSYDLTGLPPSPEEVEAFVRDAAPNAYEKVVDRLLASPRYGEHRAHYWLDAARYGDTHGLYTDEYRSVWPYRDYVIASYNQNKPFDQFTREQLAGDLLDPTDVEQIVATAFVRAGVSTDETGAIVPELRVDLQRERAEAFGAVYLGLTTGCADCHDHKFDPITQKDFYQLTAFFNNLTEDPFVTKNDPFDWPPGIRVPQPGNLSAYNAALAQRSGVQSQIDARRRAVDGLIAAWLARGVNRPRPVPSAGLVLRLRCDEEKGATLANSAPDAMIKSVTATGGAPSWGEETWLWPSFRMEMSTRLELPGIGDVEAEQPFSTGAWVMPQLIVIASAKQKVPPSGALLARADSGQGSRGWGLYCEHGGRVLFRLAHHWPDSALAVETAHPVLSRGRWNHVFATYDGSGRAAGVRLYVDGKPQAATVVKDTLAGSARTAVPLEFGRESPDASLLRATSYQDFRFYRRRLPPDEASRVAEEDYVSEIVRRPLAQWTEDEHQTVADFYFAGCDEPMKALVARKGALDAELERLGQGGTPCLVCEESPRLAYANVLTRGVYSQRTERVRADVPHFLPPLPRGAPHNRRGLAEWVVSPANPLTARVAVNRMWQEVFGAGLVETTEDFGLVGGRPSHPALLDWLAVDFRESGWNVKRFYKQLVMSATYRQSARATPALLARDPANRLLARGPRFRMDAEMLRDTALAASGLLVDKIGGPSVKPYQPDGTWEAGAFSNAKGASNTSHYVMDHGESLYRRSLYTFWKRMAEMPNMEAFDAPVRDASCTRRQRTNTPLQALVVLHDPQWLEAARQIAQRVILHAPTTGARLDYLGRLLLARPWPPADKAALNDEFGKFRAIYAAQPKAAAELIAQGESPPDPAISPTELAPWMLVASTALNLDATLNK